ncbi:MAG: CPBP family intramembrane metalloprotease [Acidobacteria bacterium]|nr:CPBP family intramembrane metalloprotease [Acidobacteriota bacterium]MBI3427287.1 CPBP family intramembrane metalloprotease [Acidobacteriota bacterium]
METAVNYCSACGQLFETGFAEACPHCATVRQPGAHALAETASAEPPAAGWGAGTGLLTWAVSVALLFGTQLIAMVIYFALQVSRTGKLPREMQIDWLLAMLSLAAAIPAHLLTLAVCWFVVTKRGQRPFWQSMGWGWHPQFKWAHATALAALMMGVAILFSKILPHQETDLEKLMKLGMSVRVLTALLAVLSAPLVEEVVYRGVLYPGLARNWGMAGGVSGATLLFALVHVPQYWGSWAAISTIVLLSLVLTLLRAATGSILPGVATHFVYNGIQALALLFGFDEVVKEKATQTAQLVWTQMTGLF